MPIISFSLFEQNVSPPSWNRPGHCLSAGSGKVKLIGRDGVFWSGSRTTATTTLDSSMVVASLFVNHTASLNTWTDAVVLS